MRECNRILEYAQSTTDVGIHFLSKGIDWKSMVLCTIADASFCNEQTSVDGELEGNRSQQGYIVGLAPAEAVNAKKMPFHFITWSSTIIKLSLIHI